MLLKASEKIKKYHPRQWVVRSDPFYKRSVPQDIDASRGVHCADSLKPDYQTVNWSSARCVNGFLFTPPCRKDLNNLHTAVWRIPFWTHFLPWVILLSVSLLLLFARPAVAQSGGGHILFGDFKVDESKVTGLKPLSFDLILYTTGGDLIARQTVANNSRYRFIELPNGDYNLVVEVEGSEIARIHVMLNESFKTDIRRDVELEWRENPAGRGTKPAVTSADVYKRTSTNEKRFAKAETAIDEKKYSEAAALLLEILNDDGNDYQIWTELGTVYLMQRDFGKAEGAYERAGEVNPSFFPSFLNLGKLRIAQKRFQFAVTPLQQSVKLKPNSAQANYLLGETYLQIKQGSKAVIYLNEALKLDPNGMAQIHLRLAVLYNAAGMKSKAAEEYEAFLKKRPEYPDRKTLEQYISENKKQ